MSDTQIFVVWFSVAWILFSAVVILLALGAVSGESYSNADELTEEDYRAGMED